MAKARKKENETPEEAAIRRKLEKVANNANRSDKVSFDRKMENLVKFRAKLKPIEEEILTLMEKKNDIIDELMELRREMVNECVHPYEHLAVQEDGTVKCRFCEKVIQLPND